MEKIPKKNKKCNTLIRNFRVPNSRKCNAKVERPPDKTSANASNAGMPEPEGLEGATGGGHFGQLVNPIQTRGG